MTLKFDGKMLVVGAGKMGAALVEGFVANGLPADQVIVQDPAPNAAIKQRLIAKGITISSDADAKLSAAPTVVLLAVKPQVLADVLPTLTSVVDASTLVISVLAGKPLGALKAGLKDKQPIIRAMPNTPAAIGAGMTVCLANAAATEAQKTLAHALFACVGDVAWIEDEALMDAVTAVSGSGPAYVFLLAEAMTDAGVAAGLAPELAEQLARATLSGAGQLLDRSEDAASVLREAVTSPGGTTAAALNVLMDQDALKKLLEKAVAAAKMRGQELAG